GPHRARRLHSCNCLFFFQAEDGIRDFHVTGVQTCALPICGLSGPGRWMAGAARDFVLGASLLDARGELMHFGGQVMKNVAGYDVSRLLCGSYGTLGVIAEVSLKVLPVPPLRWSLRMSLGVDGPLSA